MAAAYGCSITSDARKLMSVVRVSADAGRARRDVSL
jgi:hypothetical protein